MKKNEATGHGLSWNPLVLIAEIEDEISRLDNLLPEIKKISLESSRATRLKDALDESLTLKLSNFYTGCERIFQKISDSTWFGISMVMSLTVKNWLLLSRR